jgi:hypothetical protein
MEKQLNFGHLAVHRTAEVSKAIIGNYYGKWPKYSYFMGCSRGGGQSMMEAQRYAEDFDGIIAGAPAFDWISIAVEAIQITQEVYPSKLTEEHIKILQEAVLKQCHLLDGVKDSIINNPANCKFDFTTLPMCPGYVPGKRCFTLAQVKAIKTIYDGFDVGNDIKYPGFPFEVRMKKAADPAINDYMRLYLLPGVLHCGGGEGPSDADLLAILRDWVENSKPPERIVFTKKILDQEVMSRPVYPYPQEAIYDGKGNPNIESSYKLKQ